jgi:hypothetical protein
MARRPGLVGDEVALTARLIGHLPIAPAVIAVIADDADDALAELVHPVLALLAPSGSVNLHVACDDATALAGALAMYNQPPEALPEAVVEAVAAARRCGLTTVSGSTVLLFQRFVPAVASAVVRASTDPAKPVVIDGRWGLTERRSAADTFEVTADGTTIRETLARKTTASLAAAGGTHTVVMPVGWQDRYSIGPGTVRWLAALARKTAAIAGTPLALDIVLGDRGPVVVRCRPGGTGQMSRTGTDI